MGTRVSLREKGVDLNSEASYDITATAGLPS